MSISYQSHGFQFEGSSNEVIDHLRWCRANLGNITTDWDYAASSRGRRVQIWIVDDGAAMWYRLKFATVQKLNN